MPGYACSCYDKVLFRILIMNCALSCPQQLCAVQGKAQKAKILILNIFAFTTQLRSYYCTFGSYLQ